MKKLINTYSLLLSEDKIPYLHKDASYEYKGDCKMQSPRIISEMINDCFNLKEQAEEKVILLCLDAKKRMIGLFENSHGSISATLCGPANVMKRALLCSAASIVLVHNHPSHDCDLSADDVKVAESIESAGRLFGIKLDDFIIVGGDDYYSFYDHKII